MKPKVVVLGGKNSIAQKSASLVIDVLEVEWEGAKKRFIFQAGRLAHPHLFCPSCARAAGFSLLAVGRAGTVLHRQGGDVSAICPGHRAEMQTQAPTPSRRSCRNCLFEKVQTYQSLVYGVQVSQGFDAAEGRRDLFYLLRRSSPSASQLPANLLGPVVNRCFSDVDAIL